MCIRDRPFSQPRLSFYPFLLGDGLGCLDAGYDLVNSICRDDTTLSCGPEGEGDHIPLSNSKIPQGCSKARIADYSAPHEPAESNNTNKRFRKHHQTEAARSRCRHAGVPHHVNLNTLVALRERLLAVEDFVLVSVVPISMWPRLLFSR